VRDHIQHLYHLDLNLIRRHNRVAAERRDHFEDCTYWLFVDY
jgi:hypothetical protein